MLSIVRILEEEKGKSFEMANDDGDCYKEDIHIMRNTVLRIIVLME